MIAYYDLTYALPTYDAVTFCLVAEEERRKRGAHERMDIVLLPDTRSRSLLWPNTPEDKAQMMREVVIPMLHMLPGSTLTCPEERPAKPVEGSIGWQKFYKAPDMFRCFRAGIRPLRYSAAVADAAAKLIGGPPLVTITLREAEHWPERNSNPAAWMLAAEHITNRGYKVMVLRDTYVADKPFGDFTTSPFASCDLNFRAVLYQSAVLNMGVNNGPMWLAMALDVPVLMLKPTTANSSTTGGAAYLASAGLTKGSQLGVDYQQIVWADDDAETIIAAFDAWEQARKSA